MRASLQLIRPPCWEIQNRSFLAPSTDLMRQNKGYVIPAKGYVIPAKGYVIPAHCRLQSIGCCCSRGELKMTHKRGHPAWAFASPKVETRETTAAGARNASKRSASPRSTNRNWEAAKVSVLPAVYGGTKPHACERSQVRRLSSTRHESTSE